MLNKARRGRMADAEIAQLLRSELDQADGAYSDVLQQNRRRALNYYYGRPRGDEVPGRSQLQSQDVSDMVEAVVAQLTPALSSPDIAAFDPRGKDDEQQADIETAMVADQIYQENDGYLEIAQAVKDALLVRTGWLKVFVETDEQSADETLWQLSEDALAVALLPAQENETVEVLDQYPDGNDPELGPLYTAKVRRTWRHEKMRVEARRAEDFAYSSDWRRSTLEGIRFISERQEIERQELVKLGVPEKLVEELPQYTWETSATRSARYTSHSKQRGGHEWSTETVETWECYLRADLDGDGVPELWRIYYAANRVLLKEQVAFVPYATGYAIQRPFRMDGISLYDKLHNIQDGKTSALRQWADNINNTNNVRAALVENQVNLADWIASKPGGYVRVKNPNAIVPLVERDVGPSAQGFLDYHDKMRSERGGASLDLQSAEAQVAGHTAHGTERQYTARELLAAMMARNVSETLVRGLFRLVHRAMRTYDMGELELKRRGEWQRQDPREWQERARLSVNIGMTPAERMAKQAALRETIQMQMTAMQAGLGGQMVEVAGIYRAAIDLQNSAGLPAPEQYWIDPESAEAQQAAQAQQQQLRQKEAELQQTRAALLQLTLTHERYQHDTELRFKYFDALLKAETAEAELVGGATADLAKTQMAAAARANGSGESPQETQQ